MPAISIGFFAACVAFLLGGFIDDSFINGLYSVLDKSSPNPAIEAQIHTHETFRNTLYAMSVVSGVVALITLIFGGRKQ